MVRVQLVICVLFLQSLLFASSYSIAATNSSEKEELELVESSQDQDLSEPVCRICLESTTTLMNPFLEPCLCKGSSRSIHAHCLSSVLQYFGDHCRTCSAPYTKRDVSLALLLSRFRVSYRSSYFFMKLVKSLVNEKEEWSDEYWLAVDALSIAVRHFASLMLLQGWSVSCSEISRTIELILVSIVAAYLTSSKNRRLHAFQPFLQSLVSHFSSLLLNEKLQKLSLFIPLFLISFFSSYYVPVLIFSSTGSKLGARASLFVIPFILGLVHIYMAALSLGRPVGNGIMTAILFTPEQYLLTPP